MSHSVAIIYGFTEGKWHGKRLREALAKQGFRLEPDAKKADVIVAHSGGCYYVPLAIAPQQIVMLVNPTYWPGRSLGIRAQNMVLQLIRAVRPGNQSMYHVSKTLHNLGYLLWHGSTNLAMVRHAPKYNLEQEIRHDRTILVRTGNDPWLTPDFTELKKFNRHLHTVELPGDHDELWLHPEPYIHLLQSML